MIDHNLYCNSLIIHSFSLKIVFTNCFLSTNNVFYQFFFSQLGINRVLSLFILKIKNYKLFTKKVLINKKKNRKLNECEVSTFSIIEIKINSVNFEKLQIAPSIILNKKHINKIHKKPLLIY